MRTGVRVLLAHVLLSVSVCAAWAQIPRTISYQGVLADHARAQGAVLGKAMSSLHEGRGLVLVLVSLQ